MHERWRRERAYAKGVQIDALHPAVQQVVAQWSPGGAFQTLGGTMSRNLYLPGAGLVLRVHPRFVSPQRVLDERRLKRATIAAGLSAPRPVPAGTSELLRVDGRVGELETYVDHVIHPPSWPLHQQMFATLGVLHRIWAAAAIRRPVVSTYGPPSTLRTHLARLRARPLDDATRTQLARVTAALTRLRSTWVPAARLPGTVVHGDARPENLSVGSHGEQVVLDLGFAARRPRVHDLAYAMAWIVLKPDDSGSVGEFDRGAARRCVAAYEEAAGSRLSPLEREAFDGYLAGTCLYLTTIAAFLPDPASVVLGRGNLRLVEIAEDVLRRPGQVI